MTDGLIERVARLMNRRVASWRRPSGGYSSADRRILSWADGTSAFVKCATDADTAAWLRAEHRIYSHVHGPFMPELLGWQDEGESPLLVIEDLSGAIWPPPWNSQRIDSMLATLGAVAATPPPPGSESMEERRGLLAGWSRVAEDPRQFLALGVASAAWLSRTLETLLDAERRAELDGSALLHNDIRSDNSCFVGSRVVLVDWNWACRGNPAIDIAAWLPSLQLEGGPLPDAILPAAGELAALVSGFYAAHAGLPPIGVTRAVRELQLAQLRTSLAWAVRALELPPTEFDSATMR
jgi:aminoglycoside phosphotransferase (APT) family kinase protein